MTNIEILKYVDIKDLIRKTIKDIKIIKNKEIHFFTSNDEYIMLHDQDCCEYVYIEDISGDIQDLIGSPILMAEEVTNCHKKDKYDWEQWTFYKLATNKGYVTIRWCGTSNGHYSMAVDILKKQNYKK